MRLRTSLLIAALLSLTVSPALAQQVVRLDFAYYNPLSLVLKNKYWVKDTIVLDATVQWV